MEEVTYDESRTFTFTLVESRGRTESHSLKRLPCETMFVCGRMDHFTVVVLTGQDLPAPDSKHSVLFCCLEEPSTQSDFLSFCYRTVDRNWNRKSYLWKSVHGLGSTHSRLLEAQRRLVSVPLLNPIIVHIFTSYNVGFLSAISAVQRRDVTVIYYEVCHSG